MADEDLFDCANYELDKQLATRTTQFARSPVVRSFVRSLARRRRLLCASFVRIHVPHSRPALLSLSLPLPRLEAPSKRPPRPPSRLRHWRHQRIARTCCKPLELFSHHHRHCHRHPSCLPPERPHFACPLPMPLIAAN